MQMNRTEIDIYPTQNVVSLSLTLYPSTWRYIKCF